MRAGLTLMIVAAASAAAPPALAKGSASGDHLLASDAFKPLEDAGIKLDVTYTGEAAADVAGGKKRGIAYAGEAAAKIKLDMDKIAAAKGLSVHIGLVNRHGKNASRLFVGDNLFHAQEIYGAGGHVPVHLTQLYLEQKLSGGDIDLKGGRLPVMDDFGSPQHGCDFVSLTICANRGLNGNLGWTAWPRATWGASITGKVSDAVKLKTGVYEVNRHTGGRWGLHWSFDGGRGVMIPAEVDWTPTIGGLPGSYRVGASLDTARFSEWNTAINGKPLYATEAPARRTTRYSAYAIAEQQVTGDAKSGRGVTVLGGYTWNSPSHALFRDYAFLGLIDKGPFDSRPGDEAGVQVSYGRVPPALTRRQRADAAMGLPIANGAPGVQSHEEVLEAFYNYSAGHGIHLVPDVQYVHRPSGTDVYPDALVLAFRSRRRSERSKRLWPVTRRSGVCPGRSTNSGRSPRPAARTIRA